MTEHPQATIDMEDLRELIAEIIDVDKAQVTDQAHFIQDLGVDSLMALEIVIRLEKRYGINLEEEMVEVTDLRSTHDMLAKKAGGRP